MKKLLVKTALFILPVLLLHAFFLVFYTTDKGDLLRVGYIIDNLNYNYATVFKHEISEKKTYTPNLSDLNLGEINTFDVLNVGDSFSAQGAFSYQNYLSAIGGLKILNFDKFISDNPIKSVYSILKGDFLNKVKVNYIILESVERGFILRSQLLDTSATMNIDSIIKGYKKNMLQKEKEKVDYLFFSKAILTFPLINILYNINEKPLNAETYVVKTTKQLFSVDRSSLLFSSEDLERVKMYNKLEYFNKLNEDLNILAERLKEKDIKLIVLSCPDKYTLYYNYIVNKVPYPKPIFFDIMRKLPKKYLYVDAKQIFEKEILRSKDIYFYDDTHWSPKGAKIVAKEIAQLIKENPTE